MLRIAKKKQKNIIKSNYQILRQSAFFNIVRTQKLEFYLSHDKTKSSQHHLIILFSLITSFPLKSINFEIGEKMKKKSLRLSLNWLFVIFETFSKGKQIPTSFNFAKKKIKKIGFRTR